LTAKKATYRALGAEERHISGETTAGREIDSSKDMTEIAEETGESEMAKRRQKRRQWLAGSGVSAAQSK